MSEQSDDQSQHLKTNIFYHCLLMAYIGHCLDALKVRCAYGRCVYISGGILLFFFFFFFAFCLGSGRKQGSNKLAWILHRSAQFHGCCRYTFCSVAHSLKCKFSTQLHNKFIWVRTTKCHYLSKLHSKHSVLAGRGRGRRAAVVLGKLIFSSVFYIKSAHTKIYVSLML